MDDHSFPELASKVHFISQKGIGLTDWNEKVYDFVNKLPVGNIHFHIDSDDDYI